MVSINMLKLCVESLFVHFSSIFLLSTNSNIPCPLNASFAIAFYRFNQLTQVVATWPLAEASITDSVQLFCWKGKDLCVISAGDFQDFYK
jgi:hypothetical protein